MLGRGLVYRDNYGIRRRFDGPSHVEEKIKPYSLVKLVDVAHHKARESQSPDDDTPDKSLFVSGHGKQ